MTINCKGQLVDLSSPGIMGIVNITPDSFYDGGRLSSEADIVNRVSEMINEGADFIDLGGYSSRPGADHISEKEEMQRILPVIKRLILEFPSILISVDTFRSAIAKASIEAGAAIVNDITAGNYDPDMIETVSQLGVPYIIMHMQGQPQNMQANPRYKNIIQEIKLFFAERISKAREAGIMDIIIDPGFGFGKTVEHNYTLLKELELFSSIGLPILAGISRKSMIYKALNSTPKEALNGTTALHMAVLQKGANILRVHDVKEASECIKLFTMLTSS